MKTYTAPENFTTTELVDLIHIAYEHAETTGQPVQVRAAGRIQYTHDPRAAGRIQYTHDPRAAGRIQYTHDPRAADLGTY